MTTAPVVPRESQDAIFDLRATLLMLRRRQRTILIAGIVGATIALLLAWAQTPTYRAVTELEIEPSSGSVFQILNPSGDLFSEQELDTQARVLASEQVAERVVENLSLDTSPRALLPNLGVTPIGETRVLFVSYRDGDPERAAELADGFAEGYLEWRREDAVSRLLETTANLQSRKETLLQRIAEIEQEIEAATGDELRALLDEREVARSTISAIDGQLVALSDEDAFVRGGGQILRHANVPGDPIEPRPLRNLILGLLFGLSAGILYAVVRERLDDSIPSDATLTATTDGTPVLAHVPWHEEAGDGRLVTLAAPASPAGEAFRSLRTNIRFAAGDTPLRSLAVTSALPDEGKTTVAANFSVVAARAGYNTLLVDADMRQPRLHALLSADRTTGLSGVLSGQLELDDAIQGTGVEGLDVLAAGRTPPNPAELLGSQRMSDLLEQLHDQYDLVVLDVPPVLPVADALEVASMADATLIVVHAVTSRQRPVASAFEQIKRVGAWIAGTALTAVDPRNNDDFYDAGYYSRARGRATFGLGSGGPGSTDGQAAGGAVRKPFSQRPS